MLAIIYPLFGLGLQEILVIAFIVLLLFGGRKIPELMRGLGRGVSSFKEGLSEKEEKPGDEVDKDKPATG
ncbi:MAG: twin-arginine translocase TatA/TatE family subunit [Alloprevotella sp.]|nr:twin-arginine translocase TatA/TatE family subunit [Alloprevotella sp.]